MKKILWFLLFTLLLTSFIYSDDDQKAKINSSTLSVLKLRNIGPAITSGRIVDFAVNPENTAEYYVAVASGGVWKTENWGTTFKPVFDREGSYSVGCVTLDPNDPNIVWVGSGENNSQRSVAYGDGVYLSLDGGKKWKNVGLKNSEHIGKIVVDPRNSNNVYVCAQGPLWGPGGDRGLYKTTDMGNSWEKILDISENTGVSDLVFDQRNPDVMYASAYQRRRHVFTLINGGPESAIYKTVDAGKTWNKVKNGLPSVELGRIGLAISPANPDYVYAIVEAQDDKGGFFRSTDKGINWKKMSDYVASSPQYYMEIMCDPVDANKVYSLDTYTKYTLDGGKNWTSLGNRYRHVDDHALWVNPKNTKQILIGGDGGIYYSFDGAKNWEFIDNLPVTQFYKVAVDNSKPFYYIYGGTQDNNSMGGPSRTINNSGIINTDWFITNGGDGFEAAVDPDDPNIVYTQSQYGWLTRFDRRTGSKVGIKPHAKPGDTPLRWNWDSPLIISPHKGSRLYFAANVLFKSDDRGDTWEAVSGDLTRQLDRNKLEVMGKVWSVDAVSKNASTSIYGNIVALDESPLQEGLIYTGSDDGLVHVTTDGGKKWTKIDGVNGLNELIYVNDIVASNHEENRVYAAFNNHKYADFKPYIYVSEDAGKSWKSITSNLPERGSVYSIAEDHKNPNILFAGTEFGLFVTLNRGESWVQLKSGLPTIAVRDLEIQKREDDLVLASFGRGFYVLDDYSMLRELSNELLENDFHFFGIKDAPLYIEASPLGGRKNGSQGDGYYSADNPPFGAVIRYYMKEGVKTLKNKRKAQEKKLEKEGKPVPYPNKQELIDEDKEENPMLIFTIRNSDGEVIRRLKGSAGAGVKQIIWDLRYTSLFPHGAKKDYLDNKARGYFCPPGEYTVEAALSVNGSLMPVGGKQSFNVVPLGIYNYTPADREAYDEFQNEFANLYRAAYGAVRLVNELYDRVKEIRTAIKATPDNTAELDAKAKAIFDELVQLKVQLLGEPSLSGRNMSVPDTIIDRIGTIAYGNSQYNGKPTNTHKDILGYSRDELKPVLAKLKNIVENELPSIENEMEKLGSPWTKGRVPVLK